MSITLNSTTPAAPAGSTNLTWQKDGSGNVSGYMGTGLPIGVGAFIPGVGTNAQFCLYLPLAIGVLFPAGAANSYAKARVAATGSTTYTLKKNGSSFATVVWSGAGTVGAWTQASSSTFVAGDILEIDGPATADATLADIGITLYGTRT